MLFKFLPLHSRFFVFFILGIFLVITVVYAFVGSSLRGNQQYFTQQTVNLQECEKFAQVFDNYERSERYQCYLEKAALATKEFGIAATISAFQNYFHTVEGQALKGPTCHTIAHVIGEVAVSTEVKSEEILDECNSFCTSGCLNGAGHYNVLISQGTEKAEEFCNSTGASRESLGDCYHGIGHGVAEYTRYDIEKGKRMCDQLNNEDEGRFECGHAIFMEWDQILAKSVPTPADIPAFCSGLDVVYRDTCYEFTGSLEYTKSKSALDALSICSRVPKHVEDKCMGTAVEALFHTTLRSERPDLIARICDFEDLRKTRTCYYKAVSASIFTIGASAGEAGLALCKKAPHWLQKDCFLKIAFFLFNQYGEESRDMFCKNSIPSEYRKGCKQS